MILCQKKSDISMENSKTGGNSVLGTDQQNSKPSLWSCKSTLGSGNISPEISRSHEIALYTTSANCSVTEPNSALCFLSDLVKKHRML